MKTPFRKAAPPAEFDLEAWRTRHVRAGDLEEIRHAYDERTLDQLATGLENQESSLREALEGLTRNKDRLFICLYMIYVTAQTYLGDKEQAASCLIFGQDFPGVVLTLRRGATENKLLTWSNDLENPQVFCVDEVVSLQIACDPRSSYSYLRWPLRDGSWAIVPLPAFMANLWP